MSFPVACRCGQRFMAQDYLAGQRVLCPACGAEMLIQRPAEQTAQPTAAAPSGATVTCVCGRSYQAAPHLAGQRVFCPACGALLQLPDRGFDAPSPTYDAPACLTTPIRTSFQQPLTSKPIIPRGYQRAEDADRRTLRIVIGVAICVSVLAILGGGIYVFVLPMLRATPEVARQDPPGGTSPEPAGVKPVPDPPTSPEEWPVSKPAGGSSPGQSGNDPAVEPELTPPSDKTSGITSPLRGISSTPGSADLPRALTTWYEQPNQALAGAGRAGDGAAMFTHYSWMTGLLPHLGHQALYDKFDFGKPWMDEANQQLSCEVIPQFLNPADNRKRWEGFPFEDMTLTHFVGMAGIEDRRNVVAARLPRSDPRAGVFGYDQVAKREQITDGTGNTVMLIGSGELASPWVQGGGATVRGAREPYFDRLSGFGSRGQRRGGALSVMADGSVRFISADVDPAVFRALCTIHGGESVDAARWVTAASLGE